VKGGVIVRITPDEYTDLKQAEKALQGIVNRIHIGDEYIRALSALNDIRAILTANGGR
jgi:hypothetical protein